LSTTNPTWIDPGANPGLRGERPATNDLSHGTAYGQGLYKDCSATDERMIIFPKLFFLPDNRKYSSNPNKTGAIFIIGPTFHMKTLGLKTEQKRRVYSKYNMHLCFYSITILGLMNEYIKQYASKRNNATSVYKKFSTLKGSQI
jgi:hypothetical protein